MIRYFYTLLLFLLSPILLLTLYKKKPGKPSFGPRWKEHFGVTPPLENQSQAPIWVHTVSVGETIAATPFIRALKQKYPNIPIVITTTTSTGAEQTAKLSDIAEHRYMPVDLPFAIKGFLHTIKPQKMLIMETELWPNTLHYVNKYGAPITVINARLSERSALRYKKFQPIFNVLSKNLDQVLCQHQEDADRFIRLGITPERVKVTGSLKFDISVSEESLNAGGKLRSQLGQHRPVWIAASTHQGEDEQVLNAHKTVLEKHSDALLILVPRHPERFDGVYQLCENQDFNTHRRTSKIAAPSSSTQVYLADTMGEMMLLLAASDVCFMGGSLLGDKVGGHNLLEPAAVGLPCLIGPSYYNFTDITNQLTDAEAAIICKNADEIALSLISLFSSEEQRLTCKNNAFSVIQRNQGAVQKTASNIELL